MAMQAEIMVPKIRAHLQGVADPTTLRRTSSDLQHVDLEEIVKALKRASGRDGIVQATKSGDACLVG